MPLVKYLSNISYSDGTGSVYLGPDRVLTLGGLPLEVTDSELAHIRSKFVVEVLEEVHVDGPLTTDSPVVLAVDSLEAPSTVSVGSTPSSPVSNQNSPTPPAGN